MRIARRVALALVRPLGRLLLRGARGGGHILARAGKMTGLALVSGALIFVFDLLLIRDEGRPPVKPNSADVPPSRRSRPAKRKR